MLSPGFTGALIDRADAIRHDDDALAALRMKLSARLLVLDGLAPRLDDMGELSWTVLADADPASELIFLGLDEGRPCFAELPGGRGGGDGSAYAIWPLLGLMRPDQAALFAAARSLVDWHQRHGFCAVCGAGTSLFRGGWGRRCGSCGAEHFPRVDPVVIMLAEHDDAILLGRQSRFPPRRYSALAGFVEPGEAIEEAVRREIAEEAGVRCGAVRYVASQPWPFPSSLMIGCIARAHDRAITLDERELEDAMWVSRADVEKALAGDDDARFVAPPVFTIAHSLLAHWIG